MSLSIHPDLETKLRDRAQAQGLTVEAYVELLIRAEQNAEQELESLALEGLRSGPPILIEAGFWEEMHRRLDERLKKTNHS